MMLPIIHSARLHRFRSPFNPHQWFDSTAGQLSQLAQYMDQALEVPEADMLDEPIFGESLTLEELIKRLWRGLI